MFVYSKGRHNYCTTFFLKLVKSYFRDNWIHLILSHSILLYFYRGTQQVHQLSRSESVQFFLRGCLQCCVNQILKCITAERGRVIKKTKKPYNVHNVINFKQLWTSKNVGTTLEGALDTLHAIPFGVH